METQKAARPCDFLSSAQEAKPSIRPLLRWAGSKRQLVPFLAGFWHKEYSRYVEPFAGSASLFFALQPEKAVLADKNEELIGAYKVLRDRPEQLYSRVASLSADADTYYSVRAQNSRGLSQIGRAARFVYLNRYCFNGLYRTNRQGSFNVPYATGKGGALPSCSHFVACASLLKRAKLRDWDFGTTLRHVKPGDFVYLDPPYTLRSARVFREYGPKDFGADDFARLCVHLRRLDERGVAFVLSYADCDEARDAFREWNIRGVCVRRHIAGFAAARRTASELVVTNVKSGGAKNGY